MPPTVVAPTAPCTTAAARSRGPTLRASGVKRAEFVLAESDAEAAVEDADRGRHRAGRPHALLALQADPDALAGREPVRDERRLERDDAASLRERLGDLVRDREQLVHGIEPSFATHRAAAATASSGPPTR